MFIEEEYRVSMGMHGVEISDSLFNFTMHQHKHMATSEELTSRLCEELRKYNSIQKPNSNKYYCHPQNR